MSDSAPAAPKGGKQAPKVAKKGETPRGISRSNTIAKLRLATRARRSIPDDDVPLMQIPGVQQAMAAAQEREARNDAASSSADDFCAMFTEQLNKVLEFKQKTWRWP